MDFFFFVTFFLFTEMVSVDVLGAFLSFLAVYYLCGPSLLPRDIIPLIGAQLNEMEAVLVLAEAHGLPSAYGYRINLSMYFFTVVPLLVIH